MDRAPGLSVRLKLTLSYAGFLMLAGAVLLAVGYFSLSRGVHPGVIFLVRSHADLLRAFAPTAAIVMAFLLVFGLLGGWFLAGRVLAPLTRITDATRIAANGSLSHRIQLPGRRDEFRELADAFDTMLARLEAHVAEQQRFAANASHELRTPLAITQTLLDVARNDPNGDTDELVNRLHAVNTRAIDLTEALLLLSRADRRSFSREHVDLSLIAEEASETLLPLAEERGLTIETSGDLTPTVGSHALLLQLSTNLLHNAIVHNLPEQGTVWVTTSVHPTRVGAHRREHRREPHPRIGCHACRAVSAGHQTHTHRRRRCRPRPGNRQKHHPSTRRNPHPHPPGRRRAPRHGATTPRATAHWQMTISGIELGRTCHFGSSSDRTRKGAAEQGNRVISTTAGPDRTAFKPPGGRSRSSRPWFLAYDTSSPGPSRCLRQPWCRLCRAERGAQTLGEGGCPGRLLITKASDPIRSPTALDVTVKLLLRRPLPAVAWATSDARQRPRTPRRRASGSSSAHVRGADRKQRARRSSGVP